MLWLDPDDIRRMLSSYGRVLKRDYYETGEKQFPKERALYFATSHPGTKALGYKDTRREVREWFQAMFAGVEPHWYCTSGDLIVGEHVHFWFVSRCESEDDLVLIKLRWG